MTPETDKSMNFTGTGAESGKDTAAGVGALEEVLEQERAALLAGDLTQLAAIAESKETLVAALVEPPVPAAELLRGLDVKLRRNQLLLNGAMEGIRAVADRVAELRRVEAGFETYGADGQRRSVGQYARRGFEKRA